MNSLGENPRGKKSISVGLNKEQQQFSPQMLTSILHIPDRRMN